MNRWYHPAFETDLIGAAQFLESQQTGLGSEFLDAAEAAIATIMRSPHTWQIWRDGLRRFLIERFNFTIRYRISQRRSRIPQHPAHVTTSRYGSRTKVILDNLGQDSGWARGSRTGGAIV
jgi:hypothetical protein